MKVYSRNEWGSRASGLTRHRVDPSAVLYVHHSVTTLPKTVNVAREKAHMRELEGEHMKRGYSGIGYSYVVFPSGRVYQGRGFDHIPAAQQGANTGNGAVCLVGNFEHQATTWQARRSLIRLARRFPGNRLRGHRNVNATACPGRHLYAQLPRIRAWAGKRA